MIPQRVLSHPLTLHPSTQLLFPTPCFIFLTALVSRIISLSLTSLGTCFLFPLESCDHAQHGAWHVAGAQEIMQLGTRLG